MSDQAGKACVQQEKKVMFCPVCRQPMTWFGDHWKCTSIKVHDNAKRGEA